MLFFMFYIMSFPFVLGIISLFSERTVLVGIGGFPIDLVINFFGALLFSFIPATIFSLLAAFYKIKQVSKKE